MKKLWLFALPIVLVPIVTSCTNLKQSVVAINAIGSEETFVELDKRELLLLIESKQHFILESYSPYCSHCNDLEPILREYSIKNKKTIYRMDLSQYETEEEFNEAIGNVYPDIFPDSSVPSINFISDGKLTYHVSPNKHGSYTALSAILNKIYISSNITLVNTIEQFTTYKNANLNYVAYAYDLDKSESLELANNCLITKENAKAKKPILLLNMKELQSNWSLLRDFYQSETNHFISRVENGEVSSTFDYSDIDNNVIDGMISNL